MNPIAPDRMDVYDPGYLVVAGEKIVRLSRDDPRREFPAAEFRDFGKKVIVPGFIDTHVHLPQFGIIGTGKGELLDWLNNYTYPEEARFADPEYAAKISKEFFDALVANGTTTAMIYSSVHEQATDIAFEAARSKGIRALMGKVMMDQNSPPSLQERTQDSIAASVRLCEKWDGADRGRIRYVFTPRFAAACSMELMKRVGEIARERGAFVQSHLSENKDEVRWVKKLFRARSYTAVYEEAGILNERCVMAHCIHLSSKEVTLLAQRQTKIAFCPYSNRTLHSGTMRYRKLQDAGLTISLGTDIAGGPSLSMFEQMGEAINAAGILPIEALYLATLAGAVALGLSNRVGNFVRGKDADFVVADAGRYGGPLRALWNLYKKKKHPIHEVYVRGNLVYF
jgi:guanine deaminase